MDKMRSALLCVTAGLVLCGCGHKEAGIGGSGIVGEWQGQVFIPGSPGLTPDQSGKTTLLFNTDGTGQETAVAPFGTITSLFNYTFNSQAVPPILTITHKPSAPGPSVFALDNSPEVYTCRHQGKELSLLDEKGVETYRLSRP